MTKEHAWLVAHGWPGWQVWHRKDGDVTVTLTKGRGSLSRNHVTYTDTNYFRAYTGAVDLAMKQEKLDADTASGTGQESA